MADEKDLNTNTTNTDGNTGADEQQNKSDSNKQGFTQAEVDAMIESRLARERKKAEKEKADKKAEENKSAEELKKEKADKKAKEQSDKVSAMEQKLACFENNVPKANINKVIKLTKAEMDDDTNFDKAMEKVKEDFPFLFCETSGDDSEGDVKPNSTGTHSKNDSKKTTDGVMDLFLKRNPNLKT